MCSRSVISISLLGGITVGTQIASTVSDTLNEWGEEALKEQTRERAVIDATNAKLMKEQQREAEESARRAFEENVRRLGVMLEEGFVSPEEHTRLCAEAQKDFDEKIAWGRAFGPSLIEVIGKK